MYLIFSRLDFIVSLTLFPVWLAAALAVGRLATRPDSRRLRRGARIAGSLTLLALLVAAGRLLVFGRLATMDWAFVQDRRGFTMLLLLPGVLATLLLSLPRVLSAARRRSYDGDADGGTAPARLDALASPRTTLPPQLAAFGAAGGFFEKFLPPDRSAWLNYPMYGGILLVGTVWLAYRARTRAGRLSGRLATPQHSRGRKATVRLGVTVVVLGLLGALVTTGIQQSRFPATFSMMQGPMDFGGGPSDSSNAQAGHQAMAAMPGMSGMSGSGPAVSVDALKGPTDGVPDRRYTLTAQETQIRLASGRTIDAWTFNGQPPGPELRMKQGELVEITLVNHLKDAPVTTHWHGMDVPNGEDGVAGVTQNAVQPGGTYTYRFRVNESGTRWYHSHEQASEQVKRGLFGPIVIDPAQPVRPVDQDITVTAHDWETPQGTFPAFGTSDVLDHRQVAPGQKIRLRLVNTSNLTKTFTLTGVPFKVTAIDGTDVNQPTDLTDSQLVVAGAGRTDVEFTMASTPVRLVDKDAPGAGIAFSADGQGSIAPKLDGPEFDKTTYGLPAATPFTAGSHFDRTFDLTFDDWLGFYNGKFGLRQTVNGQVFPNAPMMMVKEGDLVRVRFLNRGEEDHPMHLHGHHVLVIARNGKPLTGSPIWQDTVLVRPGEEWEIAFKADNPGIWMDHCHNFLHTALGLVMHLSYEGVTTPYDVGGAANNRPD